MTTRLQESIALSLVVAMLACSEPSSIPPTSKTFDRSNPSAQINAALGGRVERGAEDDILRLEHSVPGLGGLFMQGDTIVAFVPSTMTRGQALAGLAQGATTL